MAGNGKNGLRATIEAQLDTLSDRDRKLLFGLVSVMSVAFVFLLLSWLSGVLEAQADVVRNAKDDLHQVQLMQVEYEQASRRIEASEERLREGEGGRMSAFLERASQAAQVQESAQISQQGADIQGPVRRASYRVVLRRVPLDGVVRFLYEVETSGFVAVDMARFDRVSVSDEHLLNVTLDLVGYALAED